MAPYWTWTFKPLGFRVAGIFSGTMRVPVPVVFKVRTSSGLTCNRHVPPKLTPAFATPNAISVDAFALPLAKIRQIASGTLANVPHNANKTKT